MADSDTKTPAPAAPAPKQLTATITVSDGGQCEVQVGTKSFTAANIPSAFQKAKAEMVAEADFDIGY